MAHKKVLLWALVLLTSLVLLASPIPVSHIEAALFYGLLTLGAIYFSVLLEQGEISIAFAVGLVAILTLPAGAEVTWAIFAGALAGSILRASQRNRRPHYHRTAPVSRNIATVSARATLSYALAAYVYHSLAGQPLLALVATYLLVYMTVFLLAVYIDNRPVLAALSNNWLLIALTLSSPVVLISLHVLVDPADLPSTLMIVELAILAAGLYWFSRVRYRLQRQRREMEALANVSQAMRANQDLNMLLDTVYSELARLLLIDHFEAVLYEAESRTLTQLLLVHDGKKQTSPAVSKRQPNTLIDHILSTRMPLLFEKDAPQQARQLGLLVPDESLSAWLGMPLEAAGHQLGVLVIASTNARQRFGMEEQHVLNIIAAATSAAIDNAQLYKQQAARVTHFVNLNTVLAVLTETLLPEDVMDRIISSASVISEATGIALYRYLEGRFTLVHSAGLSSEFAVSPLVKVTSVLHYEADTVIVVENVGRDTRVIQLRDAIQRVGKAAWIELPLTVGGQTIGVINLYYDTPHRFDAETIEMLRVFANQAAQAIQNADLYAVTYHALEVRIQQLSTLASMSLALTTTMNIEAICEMLLYYALMAAEAGAGVILLVGPDDTVRIMASSGYPDGAFDDPAVFLRGITGEVMREGKPVHCHDVRTMNTYIPVLPETRAQLCVPVLWRDEMLGALTLESSKTAQFDKDDSAFISQLVNQAVFALENARLFGDTSESRDRMMAILNTMTEALILIDRHEKIALANPRVDLLGLQSDALVGQDLNDLLEQTDLAGRLGFQSANEVRRIVQTMRTTTLSYHSGLFAYKLAVNGGTVYIQRAVIPVRGEGDDVAGVLLVFYDETEQYHLERAREEFSQMIIHDLRSPLTAVTSSVSLLAEMIPPESEFGSLVEKTAGTSQRAIRKLLNRVDSLLEVSRMKSSQMSLQLEVTQVSYLIENVRNELAPLAHDLGVSIVPHVLPDQPHLIMDAEKIERVLLNLLDNALKFSPPDSDVIVRAYRPADVSEAVLRVEVIDSGPGVPLEDRESVFDRFVQIQQSQSRRRSGSGLGLNFCKTAIEAHGGRIWIEDNPAGGSIFVFTLPLASE